MATTFPGTTIETRALEKGSSKLLFDGIFATGGITLSQVSIMTGLEPYLIQNWIKRGFVAPPQKRVYGKEQFARIIIINMLREALQIERICTLIQVMGSGEDRIRDDELYHRYVDMLAENEINMMDEKSVSAAVESVALVSETHDPGLKKQLERILQVMLYAHAASQFRDSAEQILATLQ
ncbi:MAG: DUF1836 domain-containing protein [Clostridia bacterium]|nr:DUF1836 domain-containing protein [Clostridia bacterium]